MTLATMSAFFAVAKRIRYAVRLRRRIKGPRRPTWDEDFETLATIFHHYGKRSHWLPLSVQRMAADSMKLPSEVVASTRFERVRARGVSAEWFLREDSDGSRVLIYLHGGGYSIGSIDSHRDLIARLCRASGCKTLAVDYRLSPEHRFPAQLEDSLAAYRWLLQRGHEPERIAIAGESAGGGLTVSTLVSLRDSAEPLPAAAVCISPWVDLEASGSSMQTNAPYDYVGRDVIRSFARRFVERRDLKNPLASPIHADLAGLPPLLLQVGGAEALLDDSVRLAERARASNTPVTLDIADDMIHAWHLFAPAFRVSRIAIRRAGEFIQRHTLRTTPGGLESTAP